MRTKNEIFDLLMGYLDMGIAMGFFTKEETKEIESLEKEYWIQSDNQVTGISTSFPRKCEHFVNNKIFLLTNQKLHDII